MTPNDHAPRNTLIVLAGGPGQPGVPNIDRVVNRYLTPEVKSAYQVVMFDQRGTGQGALACDDLQAAVGGSDFWTPPVPATQACGRELAGTRRFYGTDDSVLDLELLRRALREQRVVLNGISYGSFLGAQYARTFPRRVSQLVLDSPVPQDGFNPFGLATMRATGRVLRDACLGDETCITDPAADLAWVVRNARIDGERLNGTHLMDALAVLSLSTIDPQFNGISQLLAEARSGDTSELEAFLDALSPVGTPPSTLDAGLHMASLCSDLRFPWGRSDAPLAHRRSTARQALAEIETYRLWPYDRRTAMNQLPIAGCSVWPRTPPTKHPKRDRIPVRALILSGERDLFCPAGWGRRQLEATTRGRLLMVGDAGHGVQAGPDPTARDAVANFLLPKAD